MTKEQKGGDLILFIVFEAPIRTYTFGDGFLFPTIPPQMQLPIADRLAEDMF
jgi:hypothetical protein